MSIADPTILSQASPQLQVKQIQSTSPSPSPSIVSLTSSLVLIFQFADRCPPAYLQTFLEENSIPYQIHRTDQSILPLPSPELSWRSIVVLGGPQAAYEEKEYPYIKDLKIFLSAHVKKGSQILGICLGAQIMADVIGGSSYKGQTLELGYRPMTLTPAAPSHPFIVALSPHLNYFLTHHHDTFNLPPTVSPLIVSSTYTQAFYYPPHIYAVQFHPEADIEVFTHWVDSDAPEKLSRLGVTKEEIIKEVTDNKNEANKASKAFFKEWWKTVIQAEMEEKNKVLLAE